MMIPPIEGEIKRPGPIFRSYVKLLYQKGKLPSVKYGLYGDILDIHNVTDEHIIPKSWGGKTTEDNIALASKRRNNARGNKPISKFLTEESLKQYISQFQEVNLPSQGFKGEVYVHNLLNTINRALRMEKQPRYRNRS